MRYHCGIGNRGLRAASPGLAPDAEAGSGRRWGWQRLEALKAALHRPPSVEVGAETVQISATLNLVPKNPG